MHALARGMDLGKELDRTLMRLRGEYGAVEQEASRDIWSILIDKAESEACDKIKMIPQGEGIRAYGVVHCWFTDVSAWAYRSRQGG